MERMHGRGWKSSGCFPHYNLDVPIIELMDARTEIYLLSIGILGVSFTLLYFTYFTYFTILTRLEYGTHFHLQSDQVQIFDLPRWVRKAHNVSNWM